MTRGFRHSALAFATAGVAAFVAAGAAPLCGEETLLARHKLQPGICIWDGLNGDPSHGGLLADRVATVDGAGFHAVRLLLSPVAQRTYSLPQLRCSGGARSLTCLFLSEGYQRALAVKTLQVVMFTAYDFTSYGNQHYLDAAFLKANRQRVFDEYRELTETIMKTYSGSGRVFIISHWEGDNQVYCGSSYNFQTIEDKRAACMYSEPGKRLEGIADWLSIRQEAIAEGRKRAMAAGATNVEVYHAAEFNTIFASRKVSGASIKSKDYKGVLDTVIPFVHPDLCSYSAWESANRNRITKDLQDIAKVCAPAKVIVGEIGINADPDKHYGKMISALLPLKESVPLVFFWQALEGRGAKEPGFGLFDLDGKALHARAIDAISKLGQ
jgi:hypothetical protein